MRPWGLEGLVYWVELWVWNLRLGVSGYGPAEDLLDVLGQLGIHLRQWADSEPNMVINVGPLEILAIPLRMSDPGPPEVRKLPA